MSSPLRSEPGDSLIFEAHLPHAGATWRAPVRSLLVLYPTDENDHPAERHFIPE
jgi:hypothetical protein